MSATRPASSSAENELDGPKAACVGATRAEALEPKAAPRILSQWVDYAATAIELLAIALIVGYIFLGTARYLYARLRDHSADPTSFERFRAHLARSLLLGLEILVAADIVRTVTLDVTVRAAAALGVLVLVRTFLSWSVVVELEGRWPWQARSGGGEEAVLKNSGGS
jgi:uncharacterized membrane protein